MVQSERSAVAVIEDAGRLLIVRCEESPGAILAEFPHASIAEGESAECALRSMFADVFGARLSTTWLLDTLVETVNGKRSVKDCYICSLVAPAEPLTCQYGETTWVARDDLATIAWRGSDHEVAALVGRYWDQIFATEHL